MSLNDLKYFTKKGESFKLIKFRVSFYSYITDIVPLWMIYAFALLVAFWRYTLRQSGDFPFHELPKVPFHMHLSLTLSLHWSCSSGSSLSSLSFHKPCLPSPFSPLFLEPYIKIFLRSFNSLSKIAPKTLFYFTKRCPCNFSPLLKLNIDLIIFVWFLTTNWFLYGFKTK